MSSFLYRLSVLIKSILAVIFFLIFFCVTYLFRKSPAQYSRIRSEQVYLLKQLKQKFTDWKMRSKEEVKNPIIAPNCLLKTELREISKDPVESKKARKEQKRESKKEKKRRDSKRSSKPVKSKLHTLVISDPKGNTVEEVHFMDEDYQEVLEYMRSKKKKESFSEGVRKVPT